MRTFVGVLAIFGVVICLLVGGGYLYLSGQIPEVSLQGQHNFAIRAENAADAEAMRPELETAATRFIELFGENPRFEVALLDGPKQLNAASILLAVRKEMGTSLARLPLPFPTPRFLSMIAAQDTAARANYRQALARRWPELTPAHLDSAVNARFEEFDAASLNPRSLGHEAGHWMLAIYVEERASHNESVSLPVWLVEGIAGYCESPERRLTALAMLRAAMHEGRAPQLDSLTGMASTDDVTVSNARQHELANVTGAAENFDTVFYAECTALVAYLEQKEPGLIKRMADAATDSKTSLKPLIDSAGAFFDWIADTESF